MIWFHPPVKYRAWWNTELCKLFGAQGLAARLWARHLAPLPHYRAENDPDRLTW
jgi:hypothetical protein